MPINDPKKLSYVVEPISDQFEPIRYPIIFEPSFLDLSIIVSVKNNEGFIMENLENTIKRMNEKRDFSWELIFVDDGSTDRTSELILGFSRTYHGIFLVKNVTVNGIGACTQIGVLSAKGKKILTIDCNLLPFVFSMPIYRDFSANCVISAYSNDNTPFGAMLLNLSEIHDPLFPMKLYTREAARLIFTNIHSLSEAFSIESLFIANKAMIPIEQIEISTNLNYTYSKYELFSIWLYYTAGVWSLKKRGTVRDIEEV